MPATIWRFVSGLILCLGLLAVPRAAMGQAATDQPPPPTDAAPQPEAAPESDQAGETPTIDEQTADEQDAAADAVEDAAEGEQAADSPAAPGTLAEQLQTLRTQRDALAAEVPADAPEDAEERTRLARLDEVIAQIERQIALATGFAESARTAAQRTEEIQAAEPPAAPEIPGAGATVESLEQALANATARAASLRSTAEAEAAENERRASRRRAVPRLIAEAEDALATLRDTPATGSQGVSAAERDAKILELEARLAALRSEVPAYDAEQRLRQYTTDRALAAQKRAQDTVTEIQRLLDAARQRAAQAAAADKQAEAADTARSHPVVRAIVERDLALREMRTSNEKGPGLLDRIAQARDAALSARSKARDAADRNAELRRRVRERGGVDDTLGSLLRRTRAELGPEVQRLRRDVRSRREEQAAALQLLWSAEDERRGWADTEGVLAAMFAGDADLPGEATLPTEAGEPMPPPTDADRARAAKAAAELKETLATVVADATAYQSMLESAAANADEAADEIDSLLRFIDERVLWVRSRPTLFTALPGEVRSAVNLWTDPVRWRRLADRVPTTLATRPVDVTWPVLIAVLAIALARRARPALRHTHELVRNFTTDSASHTVRAIVLIAVLCVPWPALIFAVAWPLWLAGDGSLIAQLVGRGLIRFAVVLYMLDFARLVLREGGLGEVHFRWPKAALAAARSELRWFTPIGGFFIIVFGSLRPEDQNAPMAGIARLGFIGLMAALAVLAWRLLHPEHAFLRSTYARNKGGWISRLQYVWFIAGVAMPIMLALAAMGGYFYTAIRLELRVVLTLALALILVLVNAVAMRWLFVSRRRILYEQAVKRREAAKEQAGSSSESSVDFDFDEQVDVSAIDAQSRQLVATLLGIAAIVGLFWVWVAVFPAARMLDRVELWPELRVVQADPGVTPSPVPAATAPATTDTPANNNSSSGDQQADQTPANPLTALAGGSNGLSPSATTSTETTEASDPSADGTVTLRDLLVAAIIGFLTIAATRNLPGVLEIALLQRLPLDAAARYAISTVTRYLIMIVGIIFALNAVELGWQRVQWLAAAFTFGLAFGLQEIFANFVSGLIILFERPIRVGDTVTVGQTSGTVTRVRMRATTISDWDRRELVVPNRAFITQDVINWTLSDPITRMIVSVGVAYGSDIALARRLLLQAANEHPDVLDSPEPKVFFQAFGGSSLDFELFIYIPHIDKRLATRDAVHARIDALFRKHGVEIAFPQRDLHIRSLPKEALKQLDAARPEGSGDGADASDKGTDNGNGGEK